jgi:putative ABC transport system permease protein
MSYTATIATMGFVVIALLISLRLHMKLEKDIIIGTIRATLQLIAIGYVLHFVFASQHWAFILLMLFIMVTVASLNSAKRGKGIPLVFWRIFITISIVLTLTLGFMLLFDMIEPTPRYVIPISGMITGNSMVVASLLLNQMKQRSSAMKEEIIVALTFGATTRQASERLTKDAIRNGMIPIIDSLKTVGLVQLPGMMTGLIIGGANPIEAVRYQLLIMFSFTAASALTSMMLGYFIYPTLFNKAQQFKGWPS